jgi:hypothetical protein
MHLYWRSQRRRCEFGAAKRRRRSHEQFEFVGICLRSAVWRHLESGLNEPAETTTTGGEFFSQSVDEHHRTAMHIGLPFPPRGSARTGPIHRRDRANGSGKSSLYRALRLLADIAQGRIIHSLALEGGLPSALWAGPETFSRRVRQEIGAHEQLDAAVADAFPGGAIEVRDADGYFEVEMQHMGSCGL